MQFISYAQNFEDVMLWRGFNLLPTGFYIDVGAFDPQTDSVTCSFYERGWRGLNIEPEKTHFDRLMRLRPRDTNLNVAIGEQPGQLTLYVIFTGNGQITGLSTLDAALAERHAENGFKVERTQIEVVTLADICARHCPGEIQFLKVDVEGSERAVLAGADFRRFRPWIVLVEATEPNSQRPSHATWEPLLDQADYRFVWFDGINRFYAAAERFGELARCFQTPPNVFDQFRKYVPPPAPADAPALSHPVLDGTAQALTIAGRIAMTARCHDADRIPKVPDAGMVRVEPDGTRIQIMHNGLKMVADGYCGPWMTQLIELCRGHHEPQEEAAFDEVMRHQPAAATMLELGGWWSYYSLWFLRNAPTRHAVVVEPDPAHLAIGEANARLNGLAPQFVAGFVGKAAAPPRPFRTGSSGVIELPCLAVPEVLEQHGIDTLDILHCDAQGAETDMLASCETLFRDRRIKWVFVSTHAYQITRDPLTHQRCLEMLRRAGAVIEAEHDVHESFSGDGLIVARFGPAPASWTPIAITRNRYSESLFRNPLYDWAEALGTRDAAGWADAERVVTAAYRAILLREPEPRGLAIRTDRLLSNGGNVQQLLEELFRSAEFGLRQSDFSTKYRGTAGTPTADSKLIPGQK